MSSPHSLTFPAVQQPNPNLPHISATHAGGIQPPASFFRPSRPRQYSRPSSPSSNFHHPDAYPLSADDINQNLAESIGDPDSITDEHQLPSLKRKSREPLLASMRTPPAHSAEGRPTFESKLSDDELEAGGAYVYPPTSKGYDHSSNHQHTNFAGLQSLSAHASRNSALLSVASHSPDSSFIPTSPDRYPPLSAVPVINPKTGKYVRRYESHPSRNRFFLGGRLLTGGDSPWAFIASFTLVLIVAGVWFGTTAVWWWKNMSPAVAIVGAYLSLLTISTMLATASIDPGILPRNLDPDPPYPSTSPSDGIVRGPMPRDLKVRSDVVRVKYCPTCKTYRPPRSSHCKMCDNCVDGCDHHCQWVNNCVGRRNYTTFFALLLAATTTLVLIIVTSALQIFFLKRQEGISFRRVLGRSVGSAVVFCLSIAVIWPVAALLTYHMRLLLLNITTIEQIRNQAHKSLIPGPPPPNPFSHGNWRRNLLAVLCRPQGYSSLDGPGIMTEDRRSVNPGMVHGGEDEWERAQAQREEEEEEERRQGG